MQKIKIKELTKEIQEIQKEKEITNYRISKDINISAPTLKRFYSCETELSLSKLVALLNYLLGEGMWCLC